MTQKEYKTIKTGFNEINDIKSSGYRFLERIPEPHNSYSIILRHPRTQRTLIVTVQPLWGIVLIKEHIHVLKVITID